MSFSALLFFHVISSIKNTEFCLKPKLIFSSSFLFLLSSLLLSTARLSLIRMMDGAELWLQPSPAASWELRDTEWEVEGTVLGRESGGGGSELLGCALCCPYGNTPK